MPDRDLKLWRVDVSSDCYETHWVLAEEETEAQDFGIDMADADLQARAYLVDPAEPPKELRDYELDSEPGGNCWDLDRPRLTLRQILEEMARGRGNYAQRFFPDPGQKTMFGAEPKALPPTEADLIEEE